MRKFSAVLETPRTCSCCGSLLGSPEGLGISRGKFRLEFDEGAVFTLGHGIAVSTSGGKLVVKIRHKRGVDKSWGLRRHYNTGAFARAKSDWSRDTSDPDYGWYEFSFELPEFKPTYSTWWAQLQFVEVESGKTGFNGGPVEAHNAAVFSIKLETLE